MEYIYSQRDPRWRNLYLDNSGLTVDKFGCKVTNDAMIISYFLDRQVLPSEYVRWANEHNLIRNDGQIVRDAICKFTNNALRFSNIPNPAPGEITYGIRQVYFGALNHWVADHPRIPNIVIDPWTGTTMPYGLWRYTGEARFYLGEPLTVKRYPVDDHYPGVGKRNLVREITFKFNPWLRRQIKREPTWREIAALSTGHWDFEAVYKNRVGTEWLYKIKK